MITLPWPNPGHSPGSKTLEPLVHAQGCSPSFRTRGPLPFTLNKYEAKSSALWRWSSKLQEPTVLPAVCKSPAFPTNFFHSGQEKEWAPTTALLSLEGYFSEIFKVSSDVGRDAPTALRRLQLKSGRAAAVPSSKPSPLAGSPGLQDR